MSRQRTYQCWQDMRQRCTNPATRNFPNYGGRGIGICQRWLVSFENFLADMGHKPDGLTLERIDNDGNYEPRNCRWATRQEQRVNQRTVHNLSLDGVTKPLRHWAFQAGMSEATLLHRLRKGLPLQEALSKPINQNKRRGADACNKARWGTAAIAAEGDK